MEVNEPEIIYKDLSYKLIGLCMEVHKILGRGFTEIVYKDALEYELRQSGVRFQREKKFEIDYKKIILPLYYYADFVIEDVIVIEAKAASALSDSHSKQTLNCMAAAGLRLGILVNFGEDSLKHKRVVLWIPSVLQLIFRDDSCMTSDSTVQEGSHIPNSWNSWNSCQIYLRLTPAEGR